MYGDPGRILDDDAHDRQWELHEMIDAEGICILNFREMVYSPRWIAAIPPDEKEEIELC